MSEKELKWTIDGYLVLIGSLLYSYIQAQSTSVSFCTIEELVYQCRTLFQLEQVLLSFLFEGYTATLSPLIVWHDASFSSIPPSSILRQFSH